ncbi:SNF2-related protein [Curtobacterium sp. MCJR17_043]|nr:SNF2-related protein [Curtobacterium sp. MCJR17_043]WIB37011.1 SNF2-related protein [Curtobacterium sp. MCJR17_043]
MSFLVEHGVGGVLADDMGLGKTLQALAMIAGRRAAAPEAPPFLVVAPTSVVGNWADEAAKFVPSLRVTTIASTSLKDPARVARAAAASDVIVTSYALLRLDAAAYLDLHWSALLLDEAQFVKNPQSQTHRVAAELRAPVKIAVTGTPLENGLSDLWALFSIVAPGLLSSWTRFGEDYVKPLASPELRGAARKELTDRLRRRIRPLMLRRTKESVAADLPEKVEQVVRVTLDPAHRDLYETTLNRERLKVLDLVDDLDRNRMIVFRSLTLLRMLALSPRARVRRPRRRAERQARPAARRTRTARSGREAGARLQPVHLVPQDRRDRPRRPRGGVRVPRRVHPAPRSRHRPLPGRHRPGVPHLAQGRRLRAHPDRSGHRVRARPVVEPGRREPGRRPDAPDRTDPVGHGRTAHRGGHHRGEGARARAAESAAVRDDDRRRRAVRRGVERGGHPVAAGVTGGRNTTFVLLGDGGAAWVPSRHAARKPFHRGHQRR